MFHLNDIKGGLVVSCQSEGKDPFNSPEGIALFARAAEMGGAKALRGEGIEKIKKIKEQTSLPLIGLLKSKFEDGSVKITGNKEDFKTLIEIGCEIIAVDGTFRLREGMSGPEFIRHHKEIFPSSIILADIATVEEAIACEQAGADCISSTLNGYTPETRKNINSPNIQLIKNLCASVSIPVFGEGRINTPELAKKAMDAGAFCVIVGSAITRPRVITQWYIKEMNK